MRRLETIIDANGKYIDVTADDFDRLSREDSNIRRVSHIKDAKTGKYYDVPDDEMDNFVSLWRQEGKDINDLQNTVLLSAFTGNNADGKPVNYADKANKNVKRYYVPDDQLEDFNEIAKKESWYQNDQRETQKHFAPSDGQNAIPTTTSAAWDAFKEGYRSTPWIAPAYAFSTGVVQSVTDTAHGVGSVVEKIAGQNKVSDALHFVGDVGKELYPEAMDMIDVGPGRKINDSTWGQIWTSALNSAGRLYGMVKTGGIVGKGASAVSKGLGNAVRIATPIVGGASTADVRRREVANEARFSGGKTEREARNLGRAAFAVESILETLGNMWGGGKAAKEALTGVRKGLLNAAKNIVKEGLVEGATEFGQEGGGNLIDQIAAIDKPIEEINFKDKHDGGDIDYLSAAKAAGIGFASAALLTGGMHGVSGIANRVIPSDENGNATLRKKYNKESARETIDELSTLDGVKRWADTNRTVAEEFVQAVRDNNGDVTRRHEALAGLPHMSKEARTKFYEDLRVYLESTQSAVDSRLKAEARAAGFVLTDDGAMHGVNDEIAPGSTFTFNGVTYEVPQEGEPITWGAFADEIENGGRESATQQEFPLGDEEAQGEPQEPTNEATPPPTSEEPTPPPTSADEAIEPEPVTETETEPEAEAPQDGRLDLGGDQDEAINRMAEYRAEARRRGFVVEDNGDVHDANEVIPIGTEIIYWGTVAHVTQPNITWGMIEDYFAEVIRNRGVQPESGVAPEVAPDASTQSTVNSPIDETGTGGTPTQAPPQVPTQNAVNGTIDGEQRAIQRRQAMPPTLPPKKRGKKQQDAKAIEDNAKAIEDKGEPKKPNISMRDALDSLQSRGIPKSVITKKKTGRKEVDTKVDEDVTEEAPPNAEVAEESTSEEAPPKIDNLSDAERKQFEQDFNAHAPNFDVEAITQEDSILSARELADELYEEVNNRIMANEEAEDVGEPLPYSYEEIDAALDFLDSYEYENYEEMQKIVHAKSWNNLVFESLINLYFYNYKVELDEYSKRRFPLQVRYKQAVKRSFNTPELKYDSFWYEKDGITILTFYSFDDEYSDIIKTFKIKDMLPGSKAFNEYFKDVKITNGNKIITYDDMLNYAETFLSSDKLSHEGKERIKKFIDKWRKVVWDNLQAMDMQDATDRAMEIEDAIQSIEDDNKRGRILRWREKRKRDFDESVNEQVRSLDLPIKEDAKPTVEQETTQETAKEVVKEVVKETKEEPKQEVKEEVKEETKPNGKKRGKKVADNNSKAQLMENQERAKRAYRARLTPERQSSIQKRLESLKKSQEDAKKNTESVEESKQKAERRAEWQAQKIAKENAEREAERKAEEDSRRQEKEQSQKRKELIAKFREYAGTVLAKGGKHVEVKAGVDALEFLAEKKLTLPIHFLKYRDAFINAIKKNNKEKPTFRYFYSRDLKHGGLAESILKTLNALLSKDAKDPIANNQVFHFLFGNPTRFVETPNWDISVTEADYGLTAIGGTELAQRVYTQKSTMPIIEEAIPMIKKFLEWQAEQGITDLTDNVPQKTAEDSAPQDGDLFASPTTQEEAKPKMVHKNGVYRFGNTTEGFGVFQDKELRKRHESGIWYESKIDEDDNIVPNTYGLFYLTKVDGNNNPIGERIYSDTAEELEAKAEKLAKKLASTIMPNAVTVNGVKGGKALVASKGRKGRPKNENSMRALKERSSFKKFKEWYIATHGGDEAGLDELVAYDHIVGKGLQTLPEGFYEFRRLVAEANRKKRPLPSKKAFFGDFISGGSIGEHVWEELLENAINWNGRKVWKDPLKTDPRYKAIFGYPAKETDQGEKWGWGDTEFLAEALEEDYAYTLAQKVREQGDTGPAWYAAMQVLDDYLEWKATPESAEDAAKKIAESDELEYLSALAYGYNESALEDIEGYEKALAEFPELFALTKEEEDAYTRELEEDENLPFSRDNNTPINGSNEELLERAKKVVNGYIKDAKIVLENDENARPEGYDIANDIGKGRPHAWYDPKTNTVHLLPSATLKTLSHELGWHAAVEYARRHNPRLYSALMAYAARAPQEVLDKVRRLYGRELTGEMLLDEMGASRSENLFKIRLEGAMSKNWFRRMFNAVARLWRDLVRSVKGKTWDNMTPTEAVDALADLFASGKSLGSIRNDVKSAISKKKGVLWDRRDAEQSVLDAAFGRWDRVREYIQDHMIAMARVEEALGITNQADKVTHAEDVRYGKNEAQVNHLFNNVVNPIVDEIDRQGIDTNDLRRFLIAKFAPERNQMIRERGGNNNDGSGISDLQAFAILQEFRANGKYDKLNSVAQKIYDMNYATLDKLVESGYLSARQARTFKTKSPHYVPLREADNDTAILPHATGRYTMMTADPFAFSVQQAANAILLCNKSLVRQKLKALVEQHPEFGSVLNEPPSEGYGEKSRPNVVEVHENGKVKYIELKGTVGNHIADALTGRDMAGWHKWLEWMPFLTQKMAQLRTSYAPTFMLRNAMVDNRQVLAHMIADGFSKEAVDFEKNLVEAMGISRKYFLNIPRQRTRLSNLFDEYLAEGGLIGGASTEGYESIQNKIAKMSKRGKTSVGKARDATIGAIEAINSTAEISTRFAVYAALRQSGVDKATAVSYSRDVTVNFNKKGRLTPWLNTLWMFSNANVQDIERTLRSLTGKEAGRMGRKSQALQLALGLIAVGVAQSWLSGVFDDEDDEEEGKPVYANLTEYQKTSQKMIRLGDFFVKLNQRGIYPLFDYFGKNIGDMIFHGKKAEEATADMVKAMAEASTSFLPSNFYDPSNLWGSLGNNLLPSLIQPATQMATNKNFMGGNLRRQKYGESLPNAFNGRTTSSPISKAAAEGLSRMTGGNPGRKGAIDLAPEDLDVMVNWIFGSLGTDINRSVATIAKATKGEFDVDSTPFVRDFVRTMPTNDGRFFDAVNKFKGLEAEASKLRKRGNKKEDAKRLSSLNESSTLKNKSLIKKKIDLAYELRDKEDIAKNKSERKKLQDERLKLQAEIIKLIGE